MAPTVSYEHAIRRSADRSAIGWWSIIAVASALAAIYCMGWSILAILHDRSFGLALFIVFAFSTTSATAATSAILRFHESICHELFQRGNP